MLQYIHYFFNVIIMSCMYYMYGTNYNIIYYKFNTGEAHVYICISFNFKKIIYINIMVGWSVSEKLHGRKSEYLYREREKERERERNRKAWVMRKIEP